MGRQYTYNVMDSGIPDKTTAQRGCPMCAWSFPNRVSFPATFPGVPHVRVELPSTDGNARCEEWGAPCARGASV